MKKLFGADGIRGTIFERPLTSEDVERIGLSIGAWLREATLYPTLLIGTDTRESSDRLKVALCHGLTHAGICVVDAGVLPTAAISYLIASKGLFNAGAVISASHNPIVENGIKLFNAEGIKVNDEIEETIEEIFYGGNRFPFRTRPARVIPESNYGMQYARALAHEYRDHEWTTCRIVVDCSNGAAYQVTPQVLDLLGIPYVLLNAYPDGTNINLEAGSEYVRRNPHYLARELQDSGARVGIALDGDADRVLLVDDSVQMYNGDTILAMLALKLKHAGKLEKATIVTTQMSNSGLAEFLKTQSIEVRTVHNGDKYVTDELLQQGLTLGGEEVGHIIIHTDRAHVTGDGLRTALVLLSELADDSQRLFRDLAPQSFKWPQINASIHLGDRNRKAPDAIHGLQELIKRVCHEVADLTKLECRPASTEPVYRIMIEARFTSVWELAKRALKIGQHIQSQLNCSRFPIEILDCSSGGCIPVDKL